MCGAGVEKEKAACDNESCVRLRKKYDDIKKSHVQLCVEHCELLMKYNALLKISTEPTIPPLPIDVSNVCPPTDSVGSIFTPSEIIILESLPLEKKKDSTFILKCVEFAYKDKSALTHKTLKGTLERIEIHDDQAVAVRPAKDPMTPEKVKRIEELFVKRVTHSKCLAGEFAERIKSTNINRLIASAVRNIVSKGQPKNKSTKNNDELDL